LLASVSFVCTLLFVAPPLPTQPLHTRAAQLELALRWRIAEVQRLRAQCGTTVLDDAREFFVNARQVSFILCTVTFYANLAHSLTRSP
jgi:hypothetical protein